MNTIQAKDICQAAGVRYRVRRCGQRLTLMLIWMSTKKGTAEYREALERYQAHLQTCEVCSDDLGCA